ncbi:MAG: sigma-54-dependent Fis family transcriptional regulator [Acidobacteria bacterium]|nr:sigma-54-dependent Fis family transcriptional regulator [Acidobacteriota bacterium]
MRAESNDDIKILVADDEESVRDVVRQTLEEEGYIVHEARDGNEAVQAIARYPYNVVLTDLKMPGIGGDQVLDEVRSISPDTAVIIITAHGSTGLAVNLMHRGAAWYIEKPFDICDLRVRVAKCVQEQRLRSENTMLRSELRHRYQTSKLIGNSPAMQQIHRMVALVADKTSTVLITGETGTGKELVARAIHYDGPRGNQPLVCVNCGGIPGNLLEDELFGHVRGAFTGAHQHRIGRFELANHGTLFLDEIGTMPLDLQVKLLRVLQDREFQKLGGTATIKVDVRIIAATNVDLTEKIRKGEFREDLYYRLNVIPIHVPPLRQRREDIEPLVLHFVRNFCIQQHLPQKQVSETAMKHLVAFDWPGNVRQVENAVEMAVALSGDRLLLDLADFPMVECASSGEPVPQSIDIPEDGSISTPSFPASSVSSSSAACKPRAATRNARHPCSVSSGRPLSRS